MNAKADSASMKFFIKISIFLLFFLSSVFASAQTDSSKIKEVDKLITKEGKFFSSDIDSTSYYGLKAFHKAESINYADGIVNSLYGVIWTFAQKGKIDSSKKYFDIAEKVAIRHNKIKELVNLYNIIGITYDNIKEYDKAFFYYKKSLEYAKKLDFKAGLINAYINLAGVYFSVHDYEKETEFFLKALELAKQNKDSVSIGYIYNNLAEDYSTAHNYSKAGKYYLEAEKMLRNADDLYAYSYVLTNIADNYLKSGKYDLALEYINKSIKQTGKKLGVDFYFGETLVKAEILQKEQKYKESERLLNGLRKLISDNIEKNYIARLNYLSAYNYFKQNRFVKSRKLLKKVLSFPITDKTLPWLVKASRLLERIFVKEGDYRTALIFFNKYKTLSDSLNSLIAEKSRIDFEKQQKLHLAEAEVNSLQKDRKIYQLELKRKNELQVFLFVGGGLVILILMLVLYYTKKIRTKNKELERLNETKEQMLKIFSHDLKNSLGAIINFSSLLVNELDDLEPDEIKFMANEINFSANASNVLMTNLLNWILVSNDELPFTIEKENLCEIAAQVVGRTKPLLRGKNLTIEMNCEREIFVYADMNSVELIIRNLLSNAIKFSRENGEIIISVSEEGNRARVSVRDFGVGMTPEQIEKIINSECHESSVGTKKEKGTGLGLNLVKTFVAKNKGEFNVTSKLGEGSEFSFTLPIAEK